MKPLRKIFISALCWVWLYSNAFAQMKSQDFVSYTPQNRHFSCELPAESWQAFEHETPRGSATHLLGPALAEGLWRVAYHIHFFDKEKPGFLPAEEILKLERERDKSIGRESSSAAVWRVASRPARLFEVRETRMLPADRLPSTQLVLHHYYALFSTGGGYFMVKLSTTEEDYLRYRKEFKRFLKSFRPLGYE